MDAWVKVFGSGFPAPSTQPDAIAEVAPRGHDVRHRVRPSILRDGGRQPHRRAVVEALTHPDRPRYRWWAQQWPAIDLLESHAAASTRRSSASRSR